MAKFNLWRLVHSMTSLVFSVTNHKLGKWHFKEVLRIMHCWLRILLMGVPPTKITRTYWLISLLGKCQLAPSTIPWNLKSLIYRFCWTINAADCFFTGTKSPTGSRNVYDTIFQSETFLSWKWKQSEAITYSLDVLVWAVISLIL